MTSGFKVGGNNATQIDDLDQYFITDQEIVDRYAGGMIIGVGKNLGVLGNNDSASNTSVFVPVYGDNTKWKTVSVGGLAAGGIKTDGTLWMWGHDGYGVLGNNSNVGNSYSSPIQTVAGGTNWKQISIAYTFAGAIKTDGTLWMWGENYLGNLGTNDTVNRSSPVQTVAGGTNWKQLSSTGWTVAAIKTDGTLWTWGAGLAGGLGTGDNIDRSSPVQTILGGTDWKQISTGNGMAAAIKTDGTLWVWGYNYKGLLGTNDTVNRSTPVQTVAGGTDWKYIYLGTSMTAIKKDGTLWTWGPNTFGELGTNDTIDRSSPVQTVAGGTNWKYVVNGYYASAAIKHDGSVWVWGYNADYALGLGNLTNYSSPVQLIASGSGWRSVSLSYSGWGRMMAIVNTI